MSRARFLGTPVANRLAYSAAVRRSMWSRGVKRSWRDASDVVPLDQIIAIDAVNLYDQPMDVV